VTGDWESVEPVEDLWARCPHSLKAHEDITTTEIYLHVAIGEHGLGVVSPLDVM
jgi:hypothetical protein